MTENMVSLIVVFSIAAIIPAAILVLSKFLGGSKYNAVKLESYESGLAKTVGTSRDRFSVKFYLIAILFILFDVETVFMFPWAVNFRQLGLNGFIEMTLFIVILLAGFVYILKKGALKWD
ncbi:MAG: NADH-quinone oxidoreductase subunit A [Candidatus Sericytochromatia bacterium]|nr:NADH-quinone oxidoreductase subunit A [Candidatus Sericytochromatia bacterium]